MGNILFLISFSFLKERRVEFDPVEQLINSGQFHEALKQINERIFQQKKEASVKLFRLRAQCELAVGMINDCLADTNRILKTGFKPELQNAYQLATMAHLQIADFEEAEKMAKHISDRKKSLNIILNSAMDAKMAEANYTNQNYTAAKPLLDKLLQICPFATKYFVMRGEIAWLERDFETFQFTGDRLDQNKERSTDGIFNYRRGIAYLCANDFENARNSIRTAIKGASAPKNSTNILHRLTELKKMTHDVQNCLENEDINGADTFLSKMEAEIRYLCPQNSLFEHFNVLLRAQIDRTRSNLDTALKHLGFSIDSLSKNVNRNNFDLLTSLYVERGEILLDRADEGAACSDFLTAIKYGGKQAQRAQELMKEIEKERKKAIPEGLYEILGVKVTATHEEISKAFRSEVKKWHPDQYNNDSIKKKEAEEKMKKLNAAYDILSDESKRKIYDLERPEEEENDDVFGSWYEKMFHHQEANF